MSSRRIQTWVWWLLPLLVARALMPVGFMAQARDGKFQIVFCMAGVSLPQAAAHDDAGSDRASQSDLSCPFAHAAAAPLLDTSSSVVIAFFPSAEIYPPADLPNHASGPPRFDLARGPPALS
ncbi:MAG: hypothetical protein AB7T07_14375 [Steroidobacteraceae bacterium]